MHYQCTYLSLIFASLLLLFVRIRCHHHDDDAIISCKDSDGNAVDWFYAYKMPKHFPPQNNDENRRGLEFVYLTENSVASGWQLSNRTIDDTLSMIGRTIAQAVIGAQSGDHRRRLVVAYNDEPPGSRVDNQRGHAKGLLVADMQTAFWLVHSVPLYPNFANVAIVADSVIFPLTGRHYAQSFLCISTTANIALDTIAQQLAFNEPHYYRLDIPPTFAQTYPHLANLSNTAPVRHPPQTVNRTASVRTSSDRYSFVSFAKGRHFAADLYANWLAPQFGVDVLVEAWRHGTGALPSNCTQRGQRVFNVAAIRFAALNDYRFATTADHSKWAVSSASATSSAQSPTTPMNWICVGDLNRAQRQMHRGGGTVCLQNEAVSHQYRALVDAFDPCPKNSQGSVFNGYANNKAGVLRGDNEV